MIRHGLPRYLLCVFLLVALTRCASPIAPAYREAAAPGVTFPMVLADSQAYEGDTVIWGGTVIKTQNTPRGSLLFILETPLGSRDYPEDADASAGRFIAKTDHFVDPLVYAKGRKVTVAGKVIGARTIANRKTKLSYTYPVVQVEQLHLWKQKAPLPPLPSYYYWDAWPDPIWGFPGYYGAFDYDEDDEDED